MIEIEIFQSNKKINEHIVNMNMDTSIAITLYLAFSEYRGLQPKRISSIEFNSLLITDTILAITNNSSLKRKTQYWVLEKGKV